MREREETLPVLSGFKPHTPHHRNGDGTNSAVLFDREMNEKQKEEIAGDSYSRLDDF